MDITINYWSVLACGVIAMITGAVWYGPLFGKKWAEIVGIDPSDSQAMKKMQEAAGPLYVIQFVLVLFQALVLSHLIADTTKVTGLERSLWIWGAFVIPTLAGAVMWTNERPDLKKARFLIQSGYQLLCFILFGLIIQMWG